jgi:hypothetical protein
MRIAGVFRRFAEQCAQRGIRALAVYRPNPQQWLETPEYLELLQITRSVGLQLIDLSGAFDSVEDRETLVLASWDTHNNARGRQLLADALYDRLLSTLFEDAPAASQIPEQSADGAAALFQPATGGNPGRRRNLTPGRTHSVGACAYSRGFELCYFSSMHRFGSEFYVGRRIERGEKRIAAEGLQSMQREAMSRDRTLGTLWQDLSEWTEARIRRRLERN